MFYVYEWFIKESGKVFYVGKGHKNRYKVRKHNKLFNYILENNNKQVSYSSCVGTIFYK